MRWRRSLHAAVLVCAAALPIRSAAAAPPPVEDFTRLPFIGDIRVSPSGTRLAVAVPAAEGRTQLAVMSLAPLGAPKAIAGFGDADVQWMHWVNEDRLVFEASDSTVPGGYGPGGVFAVNHDGSAQRLLIARRPWNDETRGSRALTWEWAFHSTVDDGSRDIVVTRTQLDAGFDVRSRSLSRLDTVNGELRYLSVDAPAGAREWLLDRSHQPAAVTTHRNGRRTEYWRAGPDRPWSAVGESAAFSDEGFEPWFVDAQGHLLVLSNQGRDTSALYRFDPLAKQIEAEPLITLQGVDLHPLPEIDAASGRLLGLHFRMEQHGSYWFDAELRKLQLGIDAALPAGRVNRLSCGRCATTRFFVVRSTSDRQPGEYFLFDRSNASLQRIGAARPWLAEATQGTRSFHRVNARDGLPLPVYVTRPAGAAAERRLPAVLLVHDGPWLRGHDLGWNADAQFLASRGYLVIETEYRGSMGYGSKHFRAGMKQWGHAMQDDLADALDWAVKQGWADPKRACIVGGGSYGGYAALMGPIRHRSSYRCAVSYAGISDIELMYSINWSVISDELKHYGLPRLVGDRKDDAARLAAASPLQHAARIEVPLLLGHGGRDRIVPLDHSTKFRRAAEAAGVKVEWVFYPDEGHGWFAPANRADFWGRVEKFLARRIGASAND